MSSACMSMSRRPDPSWSTSTRRRHNSPRSNSEAVGTFRNAPEAHHSDASGGRLTAGRGEVETELLGPDLREACWSGPFCHTARFRKGSSLRGILVEARRPQLRVPFASCRHERWNSLIGKGCLLDSTPAVGRKPSGRKPVAPGLRHVAAICRDPQPAPAKSLELRGILDPTDDSQSAGQRSRPTAD